MPTNPPSIVMFPLGMCLLDGLSRVLGSFRLRSHCGTLKTFDKIESNTAYVGVIAKARLKSAIVDIQWLLFGLYVNRVQSTPAAQSEQ